MILPAGFAGASEGAGETLALVEGIVPRWATARQASELASFFEEQLAQATWQEITIVIDDRRAYPVPGTFGQHTMVTSSASMVILTIRLALVPMLLVEEKESHTLDALLVSPAGYGQVVLGKALTGLFYCTCAAVVVYAFGARWFVHGWLLLLVFALGAGFAVAIGLLMGTFIDNPSSVNLGVGLLLMILLVPALLGGLIDDRAPRALSLLMDWLPSAAFGEALTLTTLRTVRPQDWLGPVARLAGGLMVAAGLMAWRVRRVQRSAMQMCDVLTVASRSSSWRALILVAFLVMSCSPAAPPTPPSTAAAAPSTFSAEVGSLVPGPCAFALPSGIEQGEDVKFTRLTVPERRDGTLQADRRVIRLAVAVFRGTEASSRATR